MQRIKMKRKAFSLIEVTISLVVAGILLASLSPVILKKIQGTSVIAGVGANSNGRTFTADPNDPDCSPAADGSNAVDCKIQIPAGVDMVNASILSGGGGGAGATAAGFSGGQLLQSTTANGTASINIVPGLKNVKIPSLKGGGGGGGSANSYERLAQSNVLVTSSQFTIPSGARNIRAQLMSSGGGGGKAVSYSYLGRKEMLRYLNSSYIVNKSMQEDLCIRLPKGAHNGLLRMLGAPGHSGAGYSYSTGSTVRAHTGGGGGGGAYIEAAVPGNYMTPGNIVMFYPNGSMSGQNWTIDKVSIDGDANASIQIKNPSLTTTYFGIKAINGSNGTNATRSGPGRGANGSSTCYKYQNGWTKITCTDVGTKGADGGTFSTSTSVCSGTAPGAPCSKPEYPYNYKSYKVSNVASAHTSGSCSSDLRFFKKNGTCIYQYVHMAFYSFLSIRFDRTDRASASGGGGGGGAKYNVTIPNNYISAGNKITLTNPTCNPAAGGASCITQLLVTNPSGSTVYGLQAYGGAAGGAGSSAGAGLDGPNGSGGAGGAGSSTCRKYTGSWSNDTCSANGKTGAMGTVGQNIIKPAITCYGSSLATFTGWEYDYADVLGGVGGNGADNNATGKGGNGGATTASGGASAGTAGSAGYARFYYDRYESAMLSGGGGGSGGIINNLAIPQNILDNNIGGKIEIRSGAGGAARTAGTHSEVVVKNSSGNIVWGYRALGGAAGGNATTSTPGVGGAGGGCQVWSGNAWTAASCSSNGQKGGDGKKSTDGSAVAGGAAVGSGYGASGAGAPNTSTTPGSGVASGIAQITYDRYFQAAAGGGGGGGAYAQIKGIKVVPLKTYTIRIGKGGNSGGIGTKGQDGGMSYVTFEGATHYASGGVGGKVGSAQTVSANTIHGAGGANGRITTPTSGITYKNGVTGSNGATSGSNSSGGNGGASGIDTKGACGGMFVNASICQNNSINGQILSFKLPRNINKAPTLGSAGAGGAGGGWSLSNYSQSGLGSKGLDGYVYIWWQTFK